MTHAGWRTTLLAVLIACAMLACESADTRLLEPPPQAAQAATLCPDRAASDYYFRESQISSPRDDSFMRQSWFAGYLRIADAPALSCGESTEAYRLLWMPSSRNARILIVKRAGNIWQLDIVDFGDRLFAGYTPSIPPPELRKSTRSLDSSETSRIRDELKGIDFWFVPQYKNGGADDGTAFTIEGRSGDRYRAVTRVNEWDGVERVACTLFVIAGLSIPDHLNCPKPILPSR